MSKSINIREVHRYGNIMGYPKLKEKLYNRLSKAGLDMSNMDIVITMGANQAFTNIALTLCDNNDNAILITPYYFSHKLSLQLAGVNVHLCPFDETTLYPNFDTLKDMFELHKPKMIVLTTPCNPSGLVWSLEKLIELSKLCKQYDTWLVADQTYYEFLYDGAIHHFPCRKRLNYNKIIHIFSMSKSFGMPGWRVGYIAYPTNNDIDNNNNKDKECNDLTLSLRKIQDTIPTHVTMLSQILSLHCLDIDDKYNELNGKSWVYNTISSLNDVRNALWLILEELGTGIFILNIYMKFYYYNYYIYS